MTRSCHRSSPALARLGLYHPSLAALSPLERGQARQESETLANTSLVQSQGSARLPRARHSQSSRSLKDEPCSRIRRPGSRLLPQALPAALQPPAKEGLSSPGSRNPTPLNAAQLDRSIERQPQGSVKPGACPALLGHSEEAGSERGWVEKVGQRVFGVGSEGRKTSGMQGWSVLSSPAASPQRWNKLLHQQQESWELTCLCW